MAFVKALPMRAPLPGVPSMGPVRPMPMVMPKLAVKPPASNREALLLKMLGGKR